MKKNKVRPIAIHLPQFHPFEENDAWWGKGFTEWTNVTKSKPLFEGHYQPHLPADLGFYDLRLEESRLEQIALAKEYGIYGFCYYHYWFNGKLLMQDPIERMMANPKEDFPFMFCWANENWTRAWDGADREILIQQNYSLEDDLAHIQYFIPFFKDKRYICIDGKPVIAIYKSADLPEPRETIRIWREEALKHGLELYICRMDRWNTPNGQEILDLGFDSAIDFQPLSSNLSGYLRGKDQKIREEKAAAIAYINQSLFRRAKRKVNTIVQKFVPEKSEKDSSIDLRLIDYNEYVEYDLAHLNIGYKRFPCVTPSWDNAARRKNNATIFLNSTPSIFEKWVKGKKRNFDHFESSEENLFFINAWNEWAEGNHLEPCKKFGLEYLSSLKRGLEDV
ncbi:glycosyltransferase WbsX family protein [Sphingobacterium sp. MYb388]|uniref:glycosyltransferase WbsX family protein n=1 Tax=Sphingobacterium sp. MYb388 TaxID=2745437 RepID=UPI0030A5A591